MRRNLIDYYAEPVAGVYFTTDRPLCSLKEMANRSGLSVPTVSKAVQTLVDAGLVHELTGQRRNRVFAYTAYLNILNEET